MSNHTWNGLRIALIGLVGLLIPAALTLGSVRSPGTLHIATDDPSPYGYTISLLLFVIPDAILIWLLVQHPRGRIERRAFCATVATVFAMGCVLDFVFACAFFRFPNQGATLGLRLPAFCFAKGWVPDVLPIEEFGFYGFGSLFMIGLYVWFDLAWLGRTSAADPQSIARTLIEQDRALLRFHPLSLVNGGLLILAAIGFRKLFVAEPGFPGYFVFLTCLMFIPSALLYPTVKELINWQAFTVMFLILQLVSLLWEATVAVPYGWWNYHHDQMLGIFIGSWAQLPIEAVMVWIAVGFATVVLYEMFRVQFHRRELLRSKGLGETP
jgi:hypothetical protein